MDKQAHDARVLTEYLLGSLPDEESERLDELSLIDDEFAESLRAAENDLVDAYVQGELTGAKLEQFKASYLATPFGLQKVNFSQSLQVFGEKNSDSVIANAAAANSILSPPGEPRTSGWLSSLGVLKVPRFAQWGLAVAALALLIIGGWLILDNVRQRRQVSGELANTASRPQNQQAAQGELERQRNANSSSEQELARLREQHERREKEERAQLSNSSEEQRSSSGGTNVASFILSPQMRSVGQLQTVSLPPNTSVVVLKLRLEPNDYQTYRVSLLSESNRTLWRSARLKAAGTGDDKTVSISFPANLLRSQTYVVEVTGGMPNGSSELVSSYSFKVVK